MAQFLRYTYLLLALSLLTVTKGTAERRMVGVVVPLTGAVAEVGLGIRNAITLAGEDLGASGEVRFIFEDNQYDPRMTVSAVQKLITSDKVSGLVIFGSNPALAVADMVERAKIPTVAISTSKQIVKARRFIMRHHLDAEAEGELLAAEVDRRGYDTVALVTTQNDGVLTVRDDLRPRLGKRLVLEEESAPAEREFGALASRIKSLAPRAAILCMMPPQVGILAKRLKELGFKGDLVGCHPLEVDPESHLPAGSLLGSWFVGTDERAAGDFFKHYHSKFGGKAPIAATNGYDIAALFIKALNSPDPNQFLHSVRDFQGTLGRYGAGPESSFNFSAAVRVVTQEGIVYP